MGVVQTNKRNQPGGKFLHFDFSEVHHNVPSDHVPKGSLFYYQPHMNLGNLDRVTLGICMHHLEKIFGGKKKKPSLIVEK